MSLNQSFISDFSEYYRRSQRTKIRYKLHYGQVFHVLQQEIKQPVSWKLSKSVDGKFSLFITHFPTGLRSRKLDKVRLFREKTVADRVEQESNAVQTVKRTPPKRKKRKSRRQKSEEIGNVGTVGSKRRRQTGSSSGASSDNSCYRPHGSGSCNQWCQGHYRPEWGPGAFGYPGNNDIPSWGSWWCSWTGVSCESRRDIRNRFPHW